MQRTIEATTQNFPVEEDEGQRQWISSQRRPFEISYCSIFAVGWLLAFVSFFVDDVAGLVFCSTRGITPYGSASSDVSTNPVEFQEGVDLGAWKPLPLDLGFRVLHLLSHALWCVAVYRSDPAWLSRRFFCTASGFLVPLGLLLYWLCLGEGPCKRGEAGEEMQKRLLNPFGMVLRVLVYQVDVPWQCGLLLAHTMGVLLGCMDLGPREISLHLISCVAIPCMVSVVFQRALHNEYLHLMPRMGFKGAHDPGSSTEIATEEPEDMSAQQQTEQNPISAHASGPALRHEVTARRPKFKIDVAGWLKEGDSCSSAKSSVTFFDYKSNMEYKKRVAKVYSEDRADTKIKQYATDVASNIAQKQKNEGKLTVVTVFVVRGCILLMAEELHHSSNAGISFDEEAAELISCLSKDLQSEEMDITIGDETGRVVNGTIEHKRKSAPDACMPEVVLIDEPCCIQCTTSKMEISFSEAKGDWESLSAWTVVEHIVHRQDELQGSKDQQLRFDLTGRANQQIGQVHTVGVINGCLPSTYTSAMAPFLLLPKIQAHEVNGVFNQTVIESGEDRKTVWQKYFRPFCLDMHALFGLNHEDLRDMMETESETRSQYLSLLCNIIQFLYGCSAQQTIQYLLEWIDEAGVTVMVNGQELALDVDLLDSKMGEVTRAGPSEKKGQQQVDEGSIGSKGGVSGLSSAATPRAALEFTLWGGFEDPVVEREYRASMAQSTKMGDLAGAVVGLCLVPILWQVVREGRALYLCPIITQFVMCNMWFFFQNSYVHNRQPVMILHSVVRLVAYVGRASYEGWSSLPQPNNLSNYIMLLLWMVFVKPHVMKMLVRDHIILSIADLIVWTVVFLMDAAHGNLWTAFVLFVLTLGGVVLSCMAVCQAEEVSRIAFAAKYEVQDSKASGAKQVDQLGL